MIYYFISLTAAFLNSMEWKAKVITQKILFRVKTETCFYLGFSIVVNLTPMESVPLQWWASPHVSGSLVTLWVFLNHCCMSKTFCCLFHMFKVLFYSPIACHELPLTFVLASLHKSFLSKFSKFTKLRNVYCLWF